MTVRILDIGSGYGSLAQTVFDSIPDKVITRLDADPEKKPDVCHDIREPLPEELRSSYDLVLVSHVMEHIGRRELTGAFRNAISAVKNMGEVWFLVPSLEWAANEIINKRDGLHVQGTIFGGQLDPFDAHLCGFTLASLRQMVELCGLIVRKAYQSPCSFTLDDGKEYGSLQNMVIGARYDGLNDPANAIEAVL